jgi:hypothetical protein
LNTIVDVISTSGAQPASSHDAQRDAYRIYASNYKRSTRPGNLIGSVDLHLPDFDLHLTCRVLRDRQGNTYIGMPRIKVEAPDGAIHHKTLARWGSSQSEQRFQAAAFAAIAELIRKTSPVPARDRDPYLANPRFAPLFRPAPSLAVSASSASSPPREK